MNWFFFFFCSYLAVVSFGALLTFQLLPVDCAGKQRLRLSKWTSSFFFSSFLFGCCSRCWISCDWHRTFSCFCSVDLLYLLDVCGCRCVWRKCWLVFCFSSLFFSFPRYFFFLFAETRTKLLTSALRYSFLWRPLSATGVYGCWK